MPITRTLAWPNKSLRAGGKRIKSKLIKFKVAGSKDRSWGELQVFETAESMPGDSRIACVFKHDVFSWLSHVSKMESSGIIN